MALFGVATILAQSTNHVKIFRSRSEYRKSYSSMLSANSMHERAEAAAASCRQTIRKRYSSCILNTYTFMAKTLRFLQKTIVKLHH